MLEVRLQFADPEAFSYATISRMSTKLDEWFRSQPQVVRDGPASSNNPNHFVFVLQ